MDEFVTWLTEELDNRGWSGSELARRAGLVPSTVSTVITGAKRPGLDFCVGVSKALGVMPEQVLRLAGLIPALPPPVVEESEALSLLRDLPTTERSVVLKQLRGMAGQPAPAPLQASVDRPRLQSIVDRLNRLPRDRQDQTIDTILMLIEIAESNSGENETIEVLPSAAHATADSDPGA